MCHVSIQNFHTALYGLPFGWSHQTYTNQLPLTVATFILRMRGPARISAAILTGTRFIRAVA